MSTGSEHARFEPSGMREGETVQEFVRRIRLTETKIAWLKTQPVLGNPSLDRLRTALADAGFADIDLRLSDDGEDLSFKVRVTDQVAAQDTESLLRLWITTFRKSGYRTGYNICISDVEGNLVSGEASTLPHDNRAWEAQTKAGGSARNRNTDSLPPG